MPHNDTSLFIADISGFTKSLRRALSEVEAPPGHQRLMDLVVKAAGYRNIQHFKVKQPDSPVPETRSLKRARQTFDGMGRMIRWPAQTAVQRLCTWVFWSRIPARVDLTETEVNEILKAGNSFGDHVQIRRALVEHGLVTRTRDGRVYRRVEQPPPDDARLMIRETPERRAGVNAPRTEPVVSP